MEKMLDDTKKRKHVRNAPWPDDLSPVGQWEGELWAEIDASGRRRSRDLRSHGLQAGNRQIKHRG